MNINHFENKIDKTIVSRGYNYYINGHVTEAFEQCKNVYIFYIEGSDDKKLKKESRKQKRDQFEENWDIDCDESFAFIAGHTSGGVPYGVTYDDWIEMEEEGIQNNPHLTGNLDRWEIEEMGC